MEKTKKITEVKGITLIALVITIIVLLILAGISISMLSGDNSILQKATTARDNTIGSQKTEKVKIAYMAALANGNGAYTIESLQTELAKEFSESDNITIDEDAEKKEYIIKSNNVEIDRVKMSSAETLDKSVGLWVDSRKIADSGDIFNLLVLKDSSAKWNIGGNIEITATVYVETDAETGESTVVANNPIIKNTASSETIQKLNGTLDGQQIELGAYLIDYLKSCSPKQINQAMQ